jgi:Rieske Fe-S protein
MKLNRRQFLLLGAGVFAGCQAVDDGVFPVPGQERIINAGAAGNFAADGVYQNFRAQGFFLVRQGDNLFALSAICTHRKCKLTAGPGRSINCPCHGSTFDLAGQVTRGPAKRDLPMFPVTSNEQGQLLVKVSNV